LNEDNILLEGERMKKSEFKKAIQELLLREVDGMNFDEKIDFVKQALLKIENEFSNFDTSNKGKPWSDYELKLILSLAPTKENIMKLAKAFKRGYGSIEQIYRWAAEDQKVIEEKRPNDKFIKQIKRIAKEIGWRAT